MGKQGIEVDYGKLATMLLAITAATILGLAGVIDGEVISAILFTAVGYTAGNGRLAAKGELSQPMLRAKRDPDADA